MWNKIFFCVKIVFFKQKLNNCHLNNPFGKIIFKLYQILVCLNPPENIKIVEMLPNIIFCKIQSAHIHVYRSLPNIIKSDKKRYFIVVILYLKLKISKDPHKVFKSLVKSYKLFRKDINIIEVYI